VASTPDGPWFTLEPGQNAAVKAGAEGASDWRWRKYLRWRVEPQSRKEFTCAVEVEFQYPGGFGDEKHKPLYNPDIRAFELVTG
jgi:hypothetical protein